MSDMTPSMTPSMTPLRLAGIIQNSCVRHAPDFGFETRKFRPTSPDGRLMIAVCEELLGRFEVTPKDWQIQECLNGRR